MSDSINAAPAATYPQQGAAAPRTAAEVARTTPGVAQGARWFWWIAGLTLVNAGCDAAHANVNFVLGLAFTQLAHAFFESNLAIAYGIDALFIGAFWLFGQQAQGGRSWAFIVGAVLFLCDGLVYLKFQDWMPVAFHALALFYIGRGYLALKEGLKVARKA